MNLKFAVAETCESDRCQVTLVEDGRSLTAHYSPMMINRLTIYPGQLLAIDMDAAEPEIAWRWHRVRVIATTPEGASVEDPVGRRIEAVWMPGLVSSLSSGDEVWVTGFGPTMEVHTKIIDNRPEQLEQLKTLVLPRLIERISRKPEK